MKAVIDTNVLVGASIRPDKAAREIIEQCLRRSITPVLSHQLFLEYASVFSRMEIFKKSPLDNETRIELLNAFFNVCSLSEIYFKWRPTLRNEGDNHLIELAIATGTKYLISENLRDFGNADLRFDSLEICTARDFMSFWRMR